MENANIENYVNKVFYEVLPVLTGTYMGYQIAERDWLQAVCGGIMSLIALGNNQEFDRLEAKPSLEDAVCNHIQDNETC